MPKITETMSEFENIYQEILQDEECVISEFATNDNSKPYLADKTKQFLKSSLSSLLDEVESRIVDGEYLFLNDLEYVKKVLSDLRKELN